MRSARSLLAAIALVTLGLPCAASAQEELDHAIVNKSSALTDLEKNEVRAFINHWMESLRGEEGVSDSAVSTAAAKLLEALQPAASQFFLTEYRKELGRPLDEAFTQSDRIAVRLNVMVIVAELQDPANVDLLIAGLKDENPAIRYWAGQAAAATAPLLTTGNAQKALTVALGEAIAKETISQVLPQLTQAMLKMSSQEAQLALLDALNRRVKWYREHPSVSLQAPRDAVRAVALTLVGQNVKPEAVVRSLTLISARYMLLTAVALEADTVPDKLIPEYTQILARTDENLRDLLVPYLYKQNTGTTNPNLPRSLETLITNKKWSDIHARALEWHKLLIEDLQFKPQELRIDAEREAE